MNYRKFQRGFTASEMIAVFWVLIVLVGAVGWIRNIFDVAHGDFAHLSGLQVLRIVGIFLAPLGAILGFIP